MSSIGLLDVSMYLICIGSDGDVQKAMCRWRWRRAEGDGDVCYDECVWRYMYIQML